MGVRWEGTLVFSVRGRTLNNLSYVLVNSYHNRIPPSVLTPARCYLYYVGLKLNQIDFTAVGDGL